MGLKTDNQYNHIKNNMKLGAVIIIIALIFFLIKNPEKTLAFLKNLFNFAS